MWVTTSKNADAKLKGMAREIADALPLFKFAPRGVKPLSRMDRLAQRGGQTAYLVLGKSNVDGKPMLLSRHYIDDGDACMWMWREKRMEKFEVKISGKTEEADEPYEFEVGKGADSEFLAEFLGYAAGKTDGIYQESAKVGIEAKEAKGKTGAKIRVGGKDVAEFKFEWKNIDGSEEG